MRIRKTVAIAIAVTGLAAAGSGSAFAGYSGGPPPEYTGSDQASVLVCHGKNLGGFGTTVFHASGAITGNPNATACLPE